MNIIISIHNIWANKIFSGEKTLEFRNSLPKDLSVGDKVFIYETYKNLGRKMVVGYFTVKDFYKIPKKGHTGYPSFIEYYTREIVKDEELLKRVQRCDSIVMPHYHQEIVYSYMFCDDILDYMEKNHDVPELDIALYMDRTFMSKKDKGDKFTKDCDNWLENIGYYNEYGESYYSHVIEISEPVKFSCPIPITEFIGKNNELIKKAPQSWCYTTSN